METQVLFKVSIVYYKIIFFKKENNLYIIEQNDGLTRLNRIKFENRRKNWLLFRSRFYKRRMSC